MRSRVTLVTGGGSGIGAGVALALADRGHRVAVLDRVAEAARAVLFFATDDADFVTGQVLYVSGGPHG